jgi:thiol-disulfide isomerase/thioredoxin
METIKWAVAALILAAFFESPVFAANEAKQSPEQAAKPDNAPGDVAWEELKKAFIPPPQPAEWRTTPPTKEQIADFEKSNGVLAGFAADKAKDFYTKFPSHPRAQEARGLQSRLLMVAIELGVTNRQTELNALLENRLRDPAVPGDEKLRIRSQRIVEMLTEESTNRMSTIAGAEKAARDLVQEFPKKEEAYDVLLAVARAFLEEENLQKARDITLEVAKKGSGDPKEQAETQLRKLERVGKPLDLRFTDIDGNEVNLKSYAGKVVLLDFWATWCGPCVAALPELKETYAKYHPKGFEVLGISLDKERETLQKFLKDEKMTWPQHFDGAGWENRHVKDYEIEGIPTMWLIDKKGNLRNLAGRVALANKVEKLLAE